MSKVARLIDIATMLATGTGKSPRVKCTPNVLPCTVQHDGPVNASEHLWSSQTDAEGRLTTHFRGRRLHGKIVDVPQGYRGVVVAKSNRSHARDSNQAGPECSESGDPEHETEGVDEEVLTCNELASFDELVVWAHDTLAEDKNDPYIKAAKEWIQFAEQVHFVSEPTEPALKDL